MKFKTPGGMEFKLVLAFEGIYELCFVEWGWDCQSKHKYDDILQAIKDKTFKQVKYSWQDQNNALDISQIKALVISDAVGGERNYYEDEEFGFLSLWEMCAVYAPTVGMHFITHQPTENPNSGRMIQAFFWSY